MLTQSRRKLTYANVMSTIAVFGVLAGGGAYAASKIGPKDIKENAVRSKHVKNGQVKRADLRKDAVNSAKVADGSLTGDDIADASLSGADLGSQILTVTHIDNGAPFASGVASAQIKDVGGGGTTRFGSPFGISTASASFDAVATGSPASTFSVSNLDVRLPAQLAAGESRTFTLMRTPTLGLNVACTVSAGQQACQNTSNVGQTNLTGDLAVRVESSGAGLNAFEDARVGFALATYAPFSDN